MTRNTAGRVGVLVAEAPGLLPVLVVNASGQKLPGEGFYESLRSYRPSDAAGEPAVLARRERERVYRAYPSQS